MIKCLDVLNLVKADLSEGTVKHVSVESVILINFIFLCIISYFNIFYLICLTYIWSEDCSRKTVSQTALMWYSDMLQIW